MAKRKLERIESLNSAIAVDDAILVWLLLNHRRVYSLDRIL